MMSEVRRQTKNVVARLNEAYDTWVAEVTYLAENTDQELQALGPTVEPLLHHLRGMDASIADSYAWMLSL